MPANAKAGWEKTETGWCIGLERIMNYKNIYFFQKKMFYPNRLLS